MKNQTIFQSFLALLTLCELLLFVHAYTSSGKVQTTPRQDSYNNGNDNDHDHEHHPQFGGIPTHTNENNQQSNNEHLTNNYEQHGNRRSNNYDNNGNNGEANLFSRREHEELYGYPPYCVKEQNPRETCNYHVRISKEPHDANNLHFELSGHVSNPEVGGYVAVGLSLDQRMGSDHIIECVKPKSSKAIDYHSWTIGHNPPGRLKDDASVFTMDDHYPQYDSYKRILTCKFKRPIKTLVKLLDGRSIEFDLEHGKYYVLLATGDTRKDTSDSLAFHGNNPLENGLVYVSPNLLGHSHNSESYNGNTYYSRSSVGRIGSPGRVYIFGFVIFILILFYTI